jgi:TPP-dependent pyruvate/acetoin dehydrogenase alpha subunit
VTVLDGETVLDGDRARSLLATMWRIRAFEERVARLKRADEVHGLIHLSIGQEGVAAAVCGQLRATDAVYSGHRAHGHAVAKGAPLERVLAELMGRDGGLCRGMGGSMHLVDVAHGFLGATGVVGGNLPMALGSALAHRLQGNDRVSVVFFGDGAVQAGHFHESVNLATLWQLPVVFVCENNGFAEFTPRSAHTRVERVSDVVAPYGLQRHTVDGNDVGGVWTTFRAVLARARSGEGPALLECLTHRLRGHYEGDPDRYREALSQADWQRKDPLLRWQRQGVEAGWFTDADVQAAEAAAREAVDKAWKFAHASSFPATDLAVSLVYAEDETR